MKQLDPDGRVALLGLIQEQHPDRCRLFAQWHNIDWPILHDPINLIPARAVPIVVAIDEHGVVRSTRPRPEWVVNEFLKTDYPPPETESPGLTVPDLETLRSRAKAADTADDWRAVADALTVWGGRGRLDDAVAAYDAAIRKNPRDAESHFGRGVALRMRFESPRRQDSDFQAAVDAWGMALELDPNHYIYRRRIQQYGPRLSKPYPFYDWVAQAREAIRARGEAPVELAVEPRGAELATPQRQFTSSADGKEPDREGRIERDRGALIRIDAVTVPSRPRAGSTARVHVEFRVQKQAHWNNEVQPVQVWVSAPDDWKVDQQLHSLVQPVAAESRETRRAEFEVRIPEGVAGAKKLTGYALYYVCEDAQGQCLYRRQDFEIPIRVAPRE